MNALLLFLPALMAGPPPAPFILSAAEGKPARGAVERLGDGWELRLAGTERAFKSGEWTSLRRADRPLPPHPAGPHLVLTSGDRIPFEASSLSLAGDKFSFSCPWLNNGKPVEAGLAAVSLVWRMPPESGEDPFALRRRLLGVSRRRDAIVLRNGDTVEGVLTRIGEKHAELEISQKKVSVETGQAAVLVLSTFLASPLKPKGVYAMATLADGGRVSLRTASCDGITLSGTTVIGAALSVPLDRVIGLDLLQGPAVYLSDLSPSKYEHTPYLGVSWPLGVSASTAGRELRLAGSVHDRGLGLHSAAKVTYALPPGVGFFEARVGLDDVSGRRGSVRVRVLIDGKEHDLGLKRDLKHGDAPLEVRADVKGARELTLAVDFGEGGDVGDHVNWADARLIR